ncbi:hypothetical protein JOD29_001714 [Lysinibacillus composti]|nr:hypothetical protein [Lysinibacillus composti]
MNGGPDLGRLDDDHWFVVGPDNGSSFVGCRNFQLGFSSKILFIGLMKSVSVGISIRNALHPLYERGFNRNFNRNPVHIHLKGSPRNKLPLSTIQKNQKQPVGGESRQLAVHFKSFYQKGKRRSRLS